MEEKLVKSKQRMNEHGEVFTPAFIVEAMFDLVKDESYRIDSRVLEPACGEGNFLVAALERKLQTAYSKYGKNPFEYNHYALLGLMCLYGIELLEDNAKQCRENLVAVFCKHVGADEASDWAQAAKYVASQNIIQGDALTMITAEGTKLTFPEWAYLGKGKYQRRDFQYNYLTQRSALENTLFEEFSDHEVFLPKENFAPMTVKELAELGRQNA